MKQFWACLLAISFLSPIDFARAEISSLSVTQRDSGLETIFRASLPAEISLKSDFKVDWSYSIHYLAPKGYDGLLQTQQKVEKVDLRTAEFHFYLPLNGNYKVILTASILNSGKKNLISYEADYVLNDPARYSFLQLPVELIPSIQMPLIVNGDEIIQVKYGANSQIAGSTFPNGYKLTEDIRLVNLGNDYLLNESGDGACSADDGELDCQKSSVPGIKTGNLTKSYYLAHRIFYSSSWGIVIYNQARDSQVYSYLFKDKKEISVKPWDADRSPAPDANGAKVTIDCPESFKGSVLSCSFIPALENSEIKGNPIWLEISILADEVEQKKLTKLVKTKLGMKTSFKFQLPSSYRDLRLIAKTLGIGGVSQDQSWVSTKPISAVDRQKSYKSGYGSVMISSQANLNAMNFYSMATGANGKVIRSKAESWCRFALQNQLNQGAQFSSSDDWVRGCTDAAMKL